MKHESMSMYNNNNNSRYNSKFQRVPKKKNMKLQVYIVTFVLSITMVCQAQNEKIKVFLLAGQSNMDGRGDGGKLTDKDLSLLKKAQENILFAYNRKNITPLKITTPKPFHAQKFNLELIFGPELFFGIELAKKYPKDKMLLIKRSVGGTSLYGCWNPNWTEEKAKVMSEEKKPKLYTDFINYTKEVLSVYNKEEYEICGMLWVQGEADSGVKKYGETPANEYGSNLHDLIKAVRTDLGIPNLPFQIFQVGRGKVVEGMKSVASSMNNVSFIPQNLDPKSPDYLKTYGPPIGHYNYESMKKIGQWFAKDFIENYGL